MSLQPSEIRCPRCCLHAQGCVCALAQPLHNRTPVTVIRHYAERKKSSNSARLAALALQQITVHDYGFFGDRFDATPLLTPGTVLVFPDGDEVLDTPPAHLLIVDGTWRQCRRMVHRIPGLMTMPRLSLTALPRPRMRQPPVGGMSTIEAIAAGLAAAGEPEHTAPLLALFDAAVRGCRPINWPHPRD